MIEQVFPRGFRRCAVVDQQLWFMGRDIAGPGGNALLNYGFERRRLPHRGGSSAYMLPLAQPANATLCGDAGVLICWGFALYAGAFCGEQSPARVSRRDVIPEREPWAGVVIERFGDAARLVRAPVSPALHQVSELPPGVTPRTEYDRTFAATTVRAIALTFVAYERWAITTLGRAHRHASLHDAPRHKRHRFSRVAELSGVWERLARQHGNAEAQLGNSRMQ